MTGSIQALSYSRIAFQYQRHFCVALTACEYICTLIAVLTGASEILGLEVAGIVSEVGKGVSKFNKGDKVCALLDGGGYAEYAVAPEGFIMPLPRNLSFAEAAGIPEVSYYTLHSVIAQHFATDESAGIC